MKPEFYKDYTIFRTSDKKLVIMLLSKAGIQDFSANIHGPQNRRFVLVNKGLREHQKKRLRYYISKHLNKDKRKPKAYKMPEVFRGHRGCLISGHDLNFK